VFTIVAYCSCSFTGRFVSNKKRLILYEYTT